MKRYITVIGLIIAIGSIAQERNQFFFVNTGGGSHNLNYTLQDGSVNGGIGGTLNLGYSYYFNANWGVAAGFGIQSAQAKGTLNYMSGMAAVDEDGDNFELRTYFNNWEEKQKAIFLDIPVGTQYQRWFNGKNGILAYAGAKVSIPVSSSYKVTSGTITTTGYYEQWNVELTDMPQHGFTTISERPSGSITMKPSFALFAELGWLRKMSDKLDLYVGGYINYGLNSIVSTGSTTAFLESETYQSMITTADKVKLTTFGVKVGLRLSNNRKKKIAETIVEEPIPVVKEEPTVTQVEFEVEPEPKPVVEVKSEPTPEPVVATKDTIAKTQTIANQIDLKFPLDSDTPLNNEFDSKFEALAQMLKANPEMKIRIQGHTCNLASREYNLKVGLGRAEVGKAKLMQLGVPESQIAVESKAFDEPLVPNTNEENRAKNRRIVLIVE